MRRIFILVILAMLVIPCVSAFNYTIGSYEYNFGQQFTVTASGSSGTLSGYQVAVNVSNMSGISSTTMIYTNGTTRPDWTDVVFTDSSNNRLNFWKENNTETSTTAYFWVRYPTIATSGTTGRVYYGNASQLVRLEDGYSTFEAGSFDDFTTSSLNTTQFIQDGGRTAFSGGYVDFTGTKSYSLINTTATYGQNTSLVARAIFNTSGVAPAYSYLGYGKWYVSPVEIAQTYYSTGTTAKLQRVFVTNNSLNYDLSLDSRISTQSIYEVQRNGLTPLVTVLRNGSVLNASVSGGTRISTSNLHAEFAAYQYQSSMIVDWMFVRKYALYSPTLSGFTTIPLVSAPAASFTKNSTGGSTPLAVAFTDTSTGSPTTWQWTLITYSNSTWLNFSTSQNPTLTISEVGNYSVMLSASNAYGASNTSPVGSWVNTSLPTLTAAYTASINPVATGSNVSFNWSGTGTPITYDYGFGDGSANESTRNVSHKYSLPGTYYTFLNVTDAYGSYSRYTSSETAYNATGDNYQDIVMAPRFAFTIHITDKDNGLPIPVVATVTDTTNSQVNTTVAGTTTLFEDYSIIVGTISADGYQSASFQAVVDSNIEATYQLTKSSSGSRTTWYTPMHVTFKFSDQNANPISSMYVSVTPVNITTPSDWTQILIGIDPSVNINGTTISGFTASDGTWAAPMLQDILYEVAVSKPSSGISLNWSLYPEVADYAYTIPVGLAPVPTLASNVISYSLGNATINSTAEFINMTYVDGTAGTTYLLFAVYDGNNTLIYSQAYSGVSANSQAYSLQLPHPGSAAYTYGIFASQSQYGWINSTKTLTFKDYVGILDDSPGWVEFWIACCLIVVLAAGFSYFSVRFAMVVIPIFAFYLQYGLGWFDIGIGGSVTYGFIMVIGILRYIRESENKIS